MIIEFDIRFTDDNGTKYRWEGGTIIRISDGKFIDLAKNEQNEEMIHEIKDNLTRLLELGK